MSVASGKVAFIEKEMMKQEVTNFKPGDTVKVHVKIKEGDKERIQPYEGTVMAIQNTGSRKAFTVRKMSHGVGVERVFPIYSPAIAKIEVLMEGKVRRAKINYVRKLQGKAAKIDKASEAVLK
jgi:large subunit ribosomal protein L19